jgi:hypothetical protein
MSDQHDEDDDQPAPRRGALIALLVVVALVAGGIWLSQSLRSSGRIQDCVMAGRTNCAPVR